MSIYFCNSACILRGNDALERRHISGMTSQTTGSRLFVQQFVYEKISKPTLLIFCEGNPLVTCSFPGRWTSKMESIPMPWRIYKIGHQEAATAMVKVMATLPIICIKVKQLQRSHCQGFRPWTITRQPVQQSFCFSIFTFEVIHWFRSSWKNHKTRFINS